MDNLSYLLSFRTTIFRDYSDDSLRDYSIHSIHFLFWHISLTSFLLTFLIHSFLWLLLCTSFFSKPSVCSSPFSFFSFFFLFFINVDIFDCPSEEFRRLFGRKETHAVDTVPEIVTSRDGEQRGRWERERNEMAEETLDEVFNRGEGEDAHAV